MHSTMCLQRLVSCGGGPTVRAPEPTELRDHCNFVRPAGVEQTAVSQQRGMLELAEIEDKFRAVMVLSRRNLGQEHPMALGALHNLAHCLQAVGKHLEAKSVAQEAVELRQRVLGPIHTDTLSSTILLCACMASAGDQEPSEQLLTSTLHACRQNLGPRQAETIRIMSALAAQLTEADKYTEAEPLLRALLHASMSNCQPTLSTLKRLDQLGANLVCAGNLTEAEPVLRRTLDVKQQLLGPDSLSTVNSMSDLVGCMICMGPSRYGEAAAMLRQIVRLQELMPPVDVSESALASNRRTLHAVERALQMGARPRATSSRPATA